MPRHDRTVALAAASALLAAAATAGAATRVLDAPAEGVVERPFERVWQRSASDDGLFLGRVIDAVRDRRGNLCLADFGLSNLTILADDGAWLATMGREGDGPGECRMVRQVLLRPGGGYGLLQGYPARVVWFREDGTFDRDQVLGPDSPADGAVVSAPWASQTGEDLLVWVTRVAVSAEAEDGPDRVHPLRDDGRLGEPVYTAPARSSPRTDHGIDEGEVYDIWARRWVADGRGGVWVAPDRDRWRVQHWNADGELTLDLRRDHDPVVRGEASRERILAWQTRRGWARDQVTVGETEPVVSHLVMGDDGCLRVCLAQPDAREEADRPLTVADVVSPEGRWLRQERWLLPDRAALDLWWIVDPHTILETHEGEVEGDMAIACWRAG